MDEFTVRLVATELGWDKGLVTIYAVTGRYERVVDRFTINAEGWQILHSIITADRPQPLREAAE
jgi:hypothetical protein